MTNNKRFFYVIIRFENRRQANRRESECTLFGFGADASSNTRQITKNANPNPQTIYICLDIGKTKT